MLYSVSGSRGWEAAIPRGRERWLAGGRSSKRASSAAAARSRFELLALLEPYRLIIEYFLARRNLANQLAKTQSDSHNPGLRRLSMEQNHCSSLTCKAPS